MQALETTSKRGVGANELVELGNTLQDLLCRGASDGGSVLPDLQRKVRERRDCGDCGY